MGPTCLATPLVTRATLCFTSRIILAIITACSAGAWRDARTPAVLAALQPGFPAEAEYNAWAGGEPALFTTLPFVNSDPAWKWRTTAIVQNTSATTATLTLNYRSTSGTLISAPTDTLPPPVAAVIRQPA